jgi:hypothetical protein
MNCLKSEPRPKGALLLNSGYLVRPERLELPAYWFEASRSIQLSYGRTFRSAGTNEFNTQLALIPEIPLS